MNSSACDLHLINQWLHDYHLVQIGRTRLMIKMTKPKCTYSNMIGGPTHTEVDYLISYTTNMLGTLIVPNCYLSIAIKLLYSVYHGRKKLQEIEYIAVLPSDHWYRMAMGLG